MGGGGGGGKLWKSMATGKCLVFCVQQKKENHTGLEQLEDEETMTEFSFFLSLELRMSYCLICFGGCLLFRFFCSMCGQNKKKYLKSVGRFIISQHSRKFCPHSSTCYNMCWNFNNSHFCIFNWQKTNYRTVKSLALSFIIIIILYILNMLLNFHWALNPVRYWLSSSKKFSSVQLKVMLSCYNRGIDHLKL